MWVNNRIVGKTQNIGKVQNSGEKTQDIWKTLQICASRACISIVRKNNDELKQDINFTVKGPALEKWSLIMLMVKRLCYCIYRGERLTVVFMVIGKQMDIGKQIDMTPVWTALVVPPIQIYMNVLCWKFLFFDDFSYVCFVALWNFNIKVEWKIQCMKLYFEQL